MKGNRLVLAAALVLVVVPAAAHAALVSFTTTIDCPQAAATIGNPCTCPPGSGTGSGTLAFDTVSKMVSFSITTSGTSAGEIFSHVHGPGAPATAAAPILFGLPPGDPKVGTYGPLSGAEETDMLADLHYFNLHTGTCPIGEIRGQIVQAPAPSIPLLSTWGVVALAVLLLGGLAAAVVVRRQRAVA